MYGSHGLAFTGPAGLTIAGASFGSGQMAIGAALGIILGLIAVKVSNNRRNAVSFPKAG